MDIYTFIYYKKMKFTGSLTVKLELIMDIGVPIKSKNYDRGKI
jgi:hypothetical protein